MFHVLNQIKYSIYLDTYLLIVTVNWECNWELVDTLRTKKYNNILGRSQKAEIFSTLIFTQAQYWNLSHHTRSKEYSVVGSSHATQGSRSLVGVVIGELESGSLSRFNPLTTGIFSKDYNKLIFLSRNTRVKKKSESVSYQLKCHTWL